MTWAVWILVNGMAHADPPPWIPPQMVPTLNERLSGAAWKEAFERRRSELPPKPEPSRIPPPFSLKIIAVYPGTQAEKLGLKVGDCILRFENRPVISVMAFVSLRQMAAGKLSLWSADKGPFEINLTSDKMGIQLEEQWLPEAAYLSSAETNALWDDLLRVAAASRERDESVTETALFHANRLGYRGWLTANLMAQSAHAHLRHEEALAWGWRAIDSTPPE